MTWNGARLKSPRLVRVEVALGGREAGEYVAARRARGMTYAAIAREMSADTHLTIGASPLFGWELRWRRLGSETAEGERSGAT